MGGGGGPGGKKAYVTHLTLNEKFNMACKNIYVYFSVT